MKKLNNAIVLPLIGAMMCGAFACVPAQEVSDAATKSYTDLANTATLGSSLRIEPSVVYEVKSKGDLGAIESADVAPSVALLEVSAGMNVKFTDGNMEFATLFDDYLKGDVIPALRIETEELAQEFVAYMTDTYYISDIMVVSSSSAVLDLIYNDEVCFIANGVYDVSDREISSNRYDFWEHIATANSVGANILMIDGEDENAAVAANYAAALNKVCWGKVSAAESAAVGAVAAGCYGIVGDSLATMQSAIVKFEKSGFAQAQSVAAHRGITKYANENSLTSCAAAVNEGATHIEIDVQVTRDGEIILCHNSDAGYTSTSAASNWIVLKTAEELRKETLNDYDEGYGETFPTLDELIEALIDTDVIFIVELKIDGASPVALSLNPIEKIYEIFSSYDKMTGRWLAITFYGSYAKAMREVCPEIPVCCLGFAKETETNIINWDLRPESSTVAPVAQFIRFCRNANVGLDFTVTSDTYGTVKNYAVRGYLQNTWTYETTDHTSYGVNIATTNKAEEMAMKVKEVAVGNIELTAEQINSGSAKVPCRTYNGFVSENKCSIVYVDGTAEAGKTVRVLFVYQDGAYGVYSNLVKVTVK